MESVEKAQNAIRIMDGYSYEGKRILVQKAVFRKQEREGPNENDECYKCGKYGHWQSFITFAQISGLMSVVRRNQDNLGNKKGIGVQFILNRILIEKQILNTLKEKEGK